MERIWNYPNMISISRIFLAVGFVFAADKYLLLLLLMIIGFTDILDGWVARKFKQETEIGKIIDQVCDKVSMLIIVITVFIIYSLPYYFLLIFLRDFFIIIASIIMLKWKHYIIPPSNLGKALSVLQFISIGILILSRTIGLYAVIFTIIFSLIVLMDYSVKFIREIKK